MIPVPAEVETPGPLSISPVEQPGDPGGEHIYSIFNAGNASQPSQKLEVAVKDAAGVILLVPFLPER